MEQTTCWNEVYPNAVPTPGGGSCCGGGGGGGAGGAGGNTDNLGPFVYHYAFGSTDAIMNIVNLANDFPCTDKIINMLMNIKEFCTFINPFLGTKPTITWRTADLPWGVLNGGNSPGLYYALGNTQADATNAFSAIITLNKQILTNSSQLLVTATIIHETLHAYINYTLRHKAVFPPENWATSVDKYYYDLYVAQGNASNMSQHVYSMTYLFAQALTALKAADNQQHTEKECAMALLYGMDNYGDDKDPSDQIFIDQVYQTIKSQFNITDIDLSKFYINNLNAPIANRLGSCND